MYMAINAHHIVVPLMILMGAVFVILFLFWMGSLDEPHTPSHARSAEVLWWTVKVLSFLAVLFIATPAG